MIHNLNDSKLSYVDERYPGTGSLHWLRLKTRLLIILLSVSFHVAYSQQPATAVPDGNGVLYVDRNSLYTGPFKGNSWQTALTSLKAALDAASISPSIVEVRVAGGFYREQPLELTRACRIKGGFNPTTGQQERVTNPTILESSVNSHLLTVNTTAGKTTIEGCWFVRGYSNTVAGAVTSSGNIDIRHCRFLSNRGWTGGALFQQSGVLAVFNCDFISNVADHGGAIYIATDATVTNCSFNNNTASTGNAIYMYAQSTGRLNNNIIWGNVQPQVITDGSAWLDRNIIREIQVGVNGGGWIINMDHAGVAQRNVDPMFTSDPDLRLKAGSPAINGGKFDLLAELANGDDRDLAGLHRVYDDIVDLGAYERQMKQVVISIPDLQAVYGDDPLAPAVEHHPAAPLSFSSGNNNIAEAFTDTDGRSKLRIKGKGTVTIQVSHPGNAEYDPSVPGSFSLTVLPKPITITADAISKTDGDPDAELTYTLSSPLVAGDVITGSLKRTEGEDVTIYDITQHDLILNDNYTTTFTGAIFTIQKKQITVRADAKRKTYGDADPELTFTYSPALAFSDGFQHSLSREAGENAGTYSIQAGTLSLSDNYEIIFIGNDFEIHKKEISVMANRHFKTYGENDPALTYVVSPALINNDVLNGSLSRTAGEQVGVYPINAGTLDHQNYSIQFIGAPFTIDKATQQINWTQTLVPDCKAGGTLTLLASSNSGLPVTYRSSNTAVATVNGNQLTILTPGMATITAIQAGDMNYLPASEQSLDLVSRLPAHLIRKHWDDVLFFDNSSNQYKAWQWYRNDQPVSNANGQYFYESGKLNGAYHVVATDAAGNALPTCPITISPGTASHPITVMPNPVRAGQQATVKIQFSQSELASAIISLHNIQGVETGTVQNVSPNTTLTMPAFAGIYTIRLRLASGAVYSTNILVKP